MSDEVNSWYMALEHSGFSISPLEIDHRCEREFHHVGKRGGKGVYCFGRRMTREEAW